MRKVAVSVFVVAFGSSYAFGGMIGFDPIKITINPAVDPTVVSFDLSVASTTFPSFNAFNVVVGSNDGLDLTDFVFGPGLGSAFSSIVGDDEPGPGKYADDIFFGEFLLTPTILQGAVLGTLTVDATGLPVGTFEVLVDSVVDGGQSGFSAVGLPPDLITRSVGTINVIPEPATLSLLGLGVLGLILRRRRTGY